LTLRVAQSRVSARRRTWRSASDEVFGTAMQTGRLWMRIDGADEARPLAFDNMEDRPIKGSTDWAAHSVVRDVPPDATVIALGALLAGKGHVWWDDVVLEPVWEGRTPTRYGAERPSASEHRATAQLDGRLATCACAARSRRRYRSSRGRT
jgi:hypothetical protein